MKVLSAGIFAPVDEFFNLLLPLIFLIAALAEIFGGVAYGLTSNQGRILVDILFLNVVHNVFTYGMLVGLPELRDWTTAIGNGNLKKFWLQILLLNLALAAFFFLFFNATNWSPETMLLLTALTVLLPIHHAISQSMGISLLYNRSLLVSDERLALKLRRNERRERLLFLALMGGAFALALRLTLAAQVTSWLAPAALAKVGGAITGVTLLAAAGLIVNAFLFPGKGRGGKTAFSIRCLLWPLAWSSRIAASATLAVHGLEYGFVSHKMVSRSRGLQFRLLLFFILAGFLWLNGVREYFLYARSQSEHVSVAVTGLTAVSFALTFSHYYLDRLLFRMRNAASRRHCGPLLG